MLLTALKSQRDATLRQRILTKLTNDGDLDEYDAVVEDCINFMATISEARIIESWPSPSNKEILAMKKKKGNNGPDKKRRGKETHDASHPIDWRCGGREHSHRECRHLSTKYEVPQTQCERIFWKPMWNVQKWKQKNQTGDGCKIRQQYLLPPSLPWPIDLELIQRRTKRNLTLEIYVCQIAKQRLESRNCD